MAPIDPRVQAIVNKLTQNPDLAWALAQSMAGQSIVGPWIREQAGFRRLMAFSDSMAGFVVPRGSVYEWHAPGAGDEWGSTPHLREAILEVDTRLKGTCVLVSDPVKIATGWTPVVNREANPSWCMEDVMTGNILARIDAKGDHHEATFHSSVGGPDIASVQAHLLKEAASQRLTQQGWILVGSFS